MRARATTSRSWPTAAARDCAAAATTLHGSSSDSADAARSGERQPRAGEGARRAAAARDVADAGQRRAGAQARGAHASGLRRVTDAARVRLRGRQPARGGDRARSGAAAGDDDARRHDPARPRAWPGDARVAAGGARASDGQRRRQPVRPRGDADRPCQDPPVRAPGHAAVPRSRACLARPGAGVPRARPQREGPQRLREHARSQRSRPRGARQGRPRRGLPVLARLAQPPDDEPPKHRGRQRPDAPDLRDGRLLDAHEPRQRPAGGGVRARALAAAGDGLQEPDDAIAERDRA